MYLLFDIGGTKFRYAISRDRETIDEPVIVPTPKTYEEILETFRKIQKGLNKEELDAVVLGIAGSQDKEHTQILHSKNLPQVIRMPLKKDLERIFGSSVLLENDAIIAGIGEAVYGAGKGHRIVAYMTVSTGVGGARIVDGRSDVNAMGFEPGKQIIEQGENLESLISGTGVKERYGKDPREIRDEKTWNDISRLLAMGLNNTIIHWSPDIVVLGGSMILGEPSIPLDVMKKYLQDILTTFPQLPPIEKAALGDSAGLYGALELAKRHV